VRHILRRGIGVLIGGSPVLLLVASLVRASDAPHPVGLAVMLAALAIAGVNLYLSLRTGIYQRKHGSLDGYKHISGFPLIGSVLIIVAAIASFGSVPSAVLGLIAVALDTGGLAWFVIGTWNDASFWDP
jgi:hypothetical protein